MSAHVGARLRAIPLPTIARKRAPSATSKAMNSVSESLNPPGDRKSVAAEGNCVATMRGGEQPEAEVQSQTDLPRSVNSIRYARRASLLGEGEACPITRDEPRTARGLSMPERGRRVYGWSEKAPKGTWNKMRRRRGGLTRAGIRALIVAMKPGNAGGARGRRKVNA
jgi:hypothetical protein